MTPDLYIYSAEEPHRSILDYLHHLILHMEPDIDCSIKWNVLYYTRHQHVLYLNILKNSTDEVEICFARGRMFEQGRELLDFKKRKVVGGYTVGPLDTIDEAVLTMLLQESFRADNRDQHQSPWKKS